jgi:hypothetical protein
MEPVRFSWLTYIVSVVSAVGGGQLLNTLLAGHQERKRSGGKQAQTDLSQLQAALTAYRGPVLAKSVTDTEELRLLRIAYDTALEQVTDEVVVSAGRVYVEVLELFASDDPGTGEDAEREAFETFEEVIRASTKRAR